MFQNKLRAVNIHHGSLLLLVSVPFEKHDRKKRTGKELQEVSLYEIDLSKDD